MKRKDYRFYAILFLAILFISVVSWAVSTAFASSSLDGFTLYQDASGAFIRTVSNVTLTTPQDGRIFRNSDFSFEETAPSIDDLHIDFGFAVTMIEVYLFGTVTYTDGSTQSYNGFVDGLNVYVFLDKLWGPYSSFTAFPNGDYPYVTFPYYYTDGATLSQNVHSLICGVQFRIPVPSGKTFSKFTGNIGYYVLINGLEPINLPVINDILSQLSVEFAALKINDNTHITTLLQRLQDEFAALKINDNTNLKKLLDALNDEFAALKINDNTHITQLLDRLQVEFNNLKMNDNTNNQKLINKLGDVITAINNSSTGSTNVVSAVNGTTTAVNNMSTSLGNKITAVNDSIQQQITNDSALQAQTNAGLKGVEDAVSTVNTTLGDDGKANMDAATSGSNETLGLINGLKDTFDEHINPLLIPVELAKRFHSILTTNAAGLEEIYGDIVGYYYDEETISMKPIHANERAVSTIPDIGTGWTDTTIHFPSFTLVMPSVSGSGQQRLKVWDGYDYDLQQTVDDFPMIFDVIHLFFAIVLTGLFLKFLIWFVGSIVDIHMDGNDD